MKNSFFVSLFVVFSFGASQAQINLEYSIPAPDAFSFSIVKFGYAGDKYVLIEQFYDNTIQIFSLNNVLEKTITIPPAVINNYYSIYYISDNLFDLDSSIEFLVNKPLPPYGFISSTYIVKEDESILLTVDSAYHGNYQNPNLISEFADIFPTPAGTKLILKKNNYGYFVYSLPGSLPCYECSDGEFTGNTPIVNHNQNHNRLSNPSPNPTSNLTRIDYQLSNGIKQGELIFYNTMGTEVKRFKITSTFSFIHVSAQDLPSGTYYYILETSAGVSEGKKMVVIR